MRYSHQRMAVGENVGHFCLFKLHFQIRAHNWLLFELELIQTQMAQKPMLRAEVGMRVRCANNASAG